MDLGIAGRTALVCAASKGLGRGCALALARNGAQVTITARSASTLEQAAREIAAATGAEVIPVAGDITTPEGRRAALAACPEPDILVNNAGGPPPGDFRDWDENDWAAACNANMITAIMLIKAVVDGMIARRFGRIVNITSSSVKAPIPQLGLSNGARSGLTGFVAGLARQTIEHNVTINNILPGRFDTDRLRSGMAFQAQKAGRPVEEIVAQSEAQVPARRFGRPEEFGELCAFICSAQTSYITGQNFLIDGGLYPGTY
ncbi:MAG TPA: SDR family oxidoreductase [Geminicoccaceae bacterium]|nr:SDR family oxidoreductase [Geminicoccaceae bacterium]